MLADTDVSVVGSGRTDAGVHAEGQVANVHLTGSKFTPEKLKQAINGNLWRDIRILKAEKAPDDFHARFSAKRKTYLYRIVNAPVMSPFWRRYAHHEHRPLDVARMNDAARLVPRRTRLDGVCFSTIRRRKSRPQRSLISRSNRIGTIVPRRR